MGSLAGFSVLQWGLIMNGICCVVFVLPIIRVNAVPGLNGDYLQQLGFLEFSAFSIPLLLPRMPPKNGFLMTYPCHRSCGRDMDTLGRAD